MCDAGKPKRIWDECVVMMSHDTNLQIRLTSSSFLRLQKPNWPIKPFYQSFFPSLSCCATNSCADFSNYVSPVRNVAFSLSHLLHQFLVLPHGHSAPWRKNLLLSLTVHTVDRKPEYFLQIPPPRAPEIAIREDCGVSGIFQHGSTDGLDTDARWEQKSLLHTGDYVKWGNRFIHSSSI